MKRIRGARRPRNWGALVATVALAVVLLAVLTTIAGGHGALRRALPGAGDRVPAPRLLWLEFTETAELATTRITLADPAGQVVPLGPPAHAGPGGDSTHIVVVPVLRRLGLGRHTVRWQLTGRDGHPVRGQYTFQVVTVAANGARSGADSAAPPAGQSAADSALARNPAPAPDSTGARDEAAEPSGPIDTGAVMPGAGAFDSESTPYVALRWLSYVILLAGIGAVVMARITGRTATVGARHAVQTRLAGVGLAAAWLGIALALARLMAQSWAVHGADRALSPMLIGPLIGNSTWGRAWAVQLLAAILATAGFTLALHDARRSGGWRLAWLAALVAAAGTALGGHAAAAEGWRAPVLVTADFLHVLAAGSWIGGVLMLAVAVLRRADAPAAANVVRAFSPWALGGAAVLATTGLVAAWAHLEQPFAPWESRYGRVLLVKLGLVALVMLLGALNWRRLGPASGTGAGNTTLRRAVWLEVLAALAVLAVTAVLVAVSPLE